MPFECQECDFELPVEMFGAKVDTSTGEVTELSAEEVIDDADEEVPPCPKCGGTVEHVTGNS